MRTQILTGLAACAVMTVSVVFAPSSATADSSIDQEARGRDSEMFMAKRGLQNRVYLNENGQRVVRLGSDTSGEVRTQILANGDPVQESKFSQKDFDRFEGAVKELGAAEPNTMILSRYNPRDDSFEVFVPDAKAAPVRERVAQKADLGVAVGTYSWTSTTRDADSAPFYGGAKISRSGGYCSAGIPATISSGVEVMVTAGHCGPVGTAWTTPYGSVGKTAKRESGYAQTVNAAGEITGAVNDESYIADGNYAGSIFVGTGSSSSAKKITGATNPAVGTSYCMSGATSFWTCSHTFDGYITATIGTTSSNFGLLTGRTRCQVTPEAPSSTTRHPPR